MILLGLAYSVVEQSLGVAARTRLPEIGVLNWVVMGVTLVVNLFVAAYEARQGRKLGSAYLTADAAHTRSDIYVTLGVMASFAGAKAGVPWRRQPGRHRHRRLHRHPRRADHGRLLPHAHRPRGHPRGRRWPTSS